VSAGAGPPAPLAGDGRGTRPAGDSRGTRPAGGGTRRRASGVLRAGQLIAVAGGLVFIASVTVLTRYSNTGNGWKSLWQATHGDLSSPLYQADFWILVGLAALGLVFTAISAGTRGRLAMIGTAAAALGLVAYTLHIPSKGASPGFQAFGSSYWLSLGAAALMVLGAASPSPPGPGHRIRAAVPVLPGSTGPLTREARRRRRPDSRGPGRRRSERPGHGTGDMGAIAGMRRWAEWSGRRAPTPGVLARELTPG